MPKKERYTVEQVGKALRESAGLRSVAAKKLGCSPSTVLNYLTRHSQLLEVEAEAVEANLDRAEAKLMKKIDQGNMAAICFFLKCKGKHRGYVERTEISGGPTPIQYLSLEEKRLSQLTDDELATLKEIASKLTAPAVVGD